jgi:hypothetical protein
MRECEGARNGRRKSRNDASDRGNDRIQDREWYDEAAEMLTPTVASVLGRIASGLVRCGADVLREL